MFLQEPYPYSKDSGTARLLAQKVEDLYSAGSSTFINLIAATTCGRATAREGGHKPVEIWVYAPHP